MTYLKSTLLVVVSTLVTLVVLEGLLQAFVDPSRLYSTMHGVPALNQWKREVKFWSQHRDRGASSINHDPEFGWDFEMGQDRIRGSRIVPETPATGELRILAIGDSFTFGLDVQSQENFSALLDGLSGVEALNMGVPGYGIDQAYLKYMAFGRKYQPDVVVFGIYVGDYERSSVGFTSFAKPRFQPQGGELRIVGQPVPTPQQELARIDRALADKIYVAEVARNLWRRVSTGERERTRFFKKTDTIVRHMLTSLQQSLNDEQTLIVVHIPRAEAFIESHEFRDEMSSRLLDIYATAGIRHIDLAAEFTADRDGRAVFEQYYVHRDNGSVGHLSADGHARVAQLVVAALDEHALEIPEF